MHAHSLATHREIGALIQGRRGEVYRFIEHHGAATDREVMVGLGYREPGAVRPRITELVSAGLLEECGSKKCPFTRKTVRLVATAGPQKQMRLSLTRNHHENAA